MSAPLVEVRQLTKRFGAFTANDAVDLMVSGGDVVGLLGANGAGKSTLMRQVLGLLRPTTGSIRIFGSPPSRATRRRIGYVSQGLGLYEDLTVDENLAFAAGAFGAPTPELEDALAEERTTLVRDLSLGLRRRIAFAAALAHRPDLLVLDEPTSGVDPLARSRLWEIIGACAARGVGVLVSTHHLEEAEYCDRMVVMARGRVVVSGDVDAVVSGRTAVEVRGRHWEAAFQALDVAGFAVALHGTKLRVVDVSRDEVAAALEAAGVEAAVAVVPASVEEAYVILSRAHREARLYP